MEGDHPLHDYVKFTREPMRIRSLLGLLIVVASIGLGACGPTDNTDVNKDVATATPDHPKPAGLRGATGASGGGGGPAPAKGGAAAQATTDFN